jgi:ribonuclease HII
MMIVGVDEVGRGCWAGPVVAGAAALARPIAGLRDSKLLGKKRREVLSAQITSEALSFGLGWASPAEIDSIGLTRAVGLAMRRALIGISPAFDELIIDGNYNFFPHESRARAVVKADTFVPAVSAASIIAKVARDNWMASEAARQFPEYFFERHAGYGTALHREMLARHGVCALHRRSFKPIQSLLELVP